MHDEDILSMSIYSNKTLPAIVVASASYDGDIYIWSLETGSVLSKLNRIESFSTQTTRKPVLPRLPKIPNKTEKSGKTSKMPLRESQTQAPTAILKRETLKANRNQENQSSKEALTHERKNSTQRSVNLAALNTPGEEQTFGRRLSQSSIRRSTLNLNDIEAIQNLEKLKL